MLLEISSKTWKEGNIPSEWEMGLNVANIQRDIKILVRGIMLCSTEMKLLEQII